MRRARARHVADVEPVHQPRHVLIDLGVLAPRNRVVASRQVDRDLVDDAAGPAAHHQNAVGQRHGFEQIVGDEQRGLAGALERLRQFALQHDAGLRVDRGERLVEQQHGRIDRQRAGERDALAHAARQLMRIVIGEFAEVERVEQRPGALLPLGQGHSLDLDAELHVLGDGAPRQQQVLLQHEGDVRVRSFDALTVDERFAFARRIEPRADVEQRGLAAAARPDQRDDLAVAHGQAHLLHGCEAFARLFDKPHGHVAVFEPYHVGHWLNSGA